MRLLFFLCPQSTEEWLQCKVANLKRKVREIKSNGFEFSGFHGTLVHNSVSPRPLSRTQGRHRNPFLLFPFDFVCVCGCLFFLNSRKKIMNSVFTDASVTTAFWCGRKTVGDNEIRVSLLSTQKPLLRPR